MDILFMSLSSIILLLSTIICIFSLGDFILQKGVCRETSLSVFKFVGVIWCITAIIVTWTGLAMHNFNSTPIVTTHPIEVKYNTPYFFGPRNEVHELTGNSKFVDVEKFQVKWIVVPGGWKYGIYVTETNGWSIVPKELVEATH